MIPRLVATQVALTVFAPAIVVVLLVKETASWTRQALQAPKIHPAPPSIVQKNCRPPCRQAREKSRWKDYDGTHSPTRGGRCTKGTNNFYIKEEGEF